MATKALTGTLVGDELEALRFLRASGDLARRNPMAAHCAYLIANMFARYELHPLETTQSSQGINVAYTDMLNFGRFVEPARFRHREPLAPDDAEHAVRAAAGYRLNGITSGYLAARDKIISFKPDEANQLPAWRVAKKDVNAAIDMAERLVAINSDRIISFIELTPDDLGQARPHAVKPRGFIRPGL